MTTKASRSRAASIPPPKPLTYEEWHAKGVRLFGEDMLKWKFVCPSCGHVQTPEDFRQYKDQGATPDDARFNCIGRFAGGKNVAKQAFKNEGGPCNYTAGGLFRLAPVVLNPSGKESSCFAFGKATAP